MRNFCRYVKDVDKASDPAFGNYHALEPIAAADLAALLRPGGTSVGATVELNNTFATTAAAQAPTELRSAVPPVPTFGAKAKPCEAAFAPSEGGSERCGWAGAKLHVTFDFSNPLVPAWKPPPKPAKTLAEIVPPRSIKAKAPPDTATDGFKRQVAGALLACFLLPSCYMTFALSCACLMCTHAHADIILASLLLHA